LDFYKELCVETRDAKGRWENLKKLRNEAWDLLAYCYAMCVYLRAEKLNWDKPEYLWAEEWDKNPLVSKPGDGNVIKHQQQEDVTELLKKLAKQVG